VLDGVALGIFDKEGVSDKTSEGKAIEDADGRGVSCPDGNGTGVLVGMYEGIDHDHGSCE